MSDKVKNNFFESIGRLPPEEDEFVYQINPDVLDKALRIIKTFALKSDYDFYGASIVPYKSSAVLNLRVSNFDTDNLSSDFYDLIKCASGITLIPGTDFMTIKICVDDFYNKLTDEDMSIVF